MNEDASLSWTVTALVRAAADALKARFAVVSVKGEISGFTRAASGHCYFALKDTSSQIRCAMFAHAANLLAFKPANGDEVQVQGRLAVYGQRGELQLVVEAMRPVGQGKLLEQFQRLKTKLEQEGLFDTVRKRTIPAFAQAVGIVSSLKAAALHDILIALHRRAPYVRIVIYPASVQGAQAAAELAAAIENANQRHEVDTLLVCRGGGSLEDLWSFNEEVVVRVVAASHIPIISGVGHETDFTLTDFAADLRAPTPTAAAELAAPPQADLLKRLSQHHQAMQRQLRYRLEQLAQRVDHAAFVLKQPTAFLHSQKNRLEHAALQLSMSRMHQLQHKTLQFDEWQRRLPQAVRYKLQNSHSTLNQYTARWQRHAPVRQMQAQSQQLERLAWRCDYAAKQQLNAKRQMLGGGAVQLEHAAAQMVAAHQQRLHELSIRLKAVDPSQVLSRGYAWVTDERGQLVNSVTQLQPGQGIQTQFADGQAHAKVEQVMPDLLGPSNKGAGV